MEYTWHSIVKIGQSLYREAPGMDVFRPDQETPVKRYVAAMIADIPFITNAAAAAAARLSCIANV